MRDLTLAVLVKEFDSSHESVDYSYWGLTGGANLDIIRILRRGPTKVCLADRGCSYALAESS